MHIIVLLILGVILLFNWLIGHWFARVLTFLLFMPILGVLGALMTGSDIPGQPNHAWLGLLIGITLAWPVAGIPAWVRKAQACQARVVRRTRCSHDAAFAEAPISLTLR